MSRDPAKLYPDFYERFKKIWIAMADIDHPIFLTDGWRSIETQEELYSLGRDLPGQIVTNAKPYQSMHHYGLAADVAFVGDEPYSESHPWHILGDVAKRYGCKWGGDWKSFQDRPHIYQDYDCTWMELSKVYKKYDLEEVWKYIDNKKKIKEKKK